MSKVWKIYRQGTSSNPVAEVHELELHDEWMGECFLTVSVMSAEPVDFAVGDYIDYRGERYTIEYDPTVLKKARRGSYGEGFTYDNIKFVSEAQAKIVRCDFTDIVLYDNGQHYTSLPTFPFYCETVDDLLDRIQANLNELYDKDFIIIGMDNARNQQRANVNGNGSKAQSEYEKWIGGGSSDYGSKGVALTVDNINCWDALAKVHSDFGLNFIVRGYTIIVGTAGMFTQHNFTYGKGNGLYEVERICDSEQQIVTRLRAYGAETNLPLNYYANLYKKPILKGFRNKEKSEIAGRDWFYGIKTNILWDNVKGAFNQNADSAQCQVSYNGVTATAWVVTRTNGVDNGPQYLYLSFITDNDQDIAFYNALGDDSEKTMDILSGVKKEKWPSSLMESIGGYNYPAALVINRLMLPGFPDTDLHTWVASNRASLLTEGFEFSTNAERPYIDSPNTALYGIRPGSIYFDGNNDTTDIHPTITGSGYDEIVSATQVDDQGVFNDKDPDPITIVIPGMGDFKLDEAWKENESSIDITDGMCGGRSFQIVKVPKKVDGNWECQCKRAKDDTLHLWFPYCDFQINANGRSDHFVLTGIDLPDEYVRLASERLFDEAIEALRKNDAPRFTYQPRIDEIWMQRQDDLAKASQADDNVSDIPSIHDTLKAGDIFRFADGDIIGVDENDQPIVNSIIIDVLTIKENGNNGIPTYEVTLRDEKQVSTIQKIQNKIDSLASGGNGYGGGGGGSSMTAAQIDSLVPSAGENYFISKQKDDSANGIITFLKGIKIGLQKLFGWDADGNITANNVTANSFDVEKFTAHQSMMNEIYSDNYNWDTGMNGTGFILTKFGPNNHAFLALDDLVVRGKMTVNTLEIREETYTGGNQHWSPAGSVIFRVDYLDGNGTPLGYQTVAAPWLLNGQPFLTVENQNLSSIAYASRREVRELIGDQITDVKTFRCYIIADNGSTTTRNFWCIGDQARCQTYNIVSRDKRDGEGEPTVGSIQTIDPLEDVPLNQKDGEKTMENVYYWRLVVGVGSAKLEDGKTYNYIDLSNQNGEDGQGHVIKRTYAEGSDIPATGDTLVCFGNDRNTDRMGVVSIETYNSANELHTDETPAIKMYAGINDFTMNGKRTAIFSPGLVEINSNVFRLRTFDGSVTPVTNLRGKWSSTEKYHYGDMVSHNGSNWLCIIDSDYYWVDGWVDEDDPNYANRNLHYDPNNPKTHLYKDGLLDDGESGFEYSVGHLVGYPNHALRLIQTFVTGVEPSKSQQVSLIWAWKGEAEAGPRGDFKSRVFIRSAITPLTPANDTPQGSNYNTYDYPIPHPMTHIIDEGEPDEHTVTETWSDGVPDGEYQIWSSVCTFHGDGTKTNWSDPAPESDSQTQDIEFSAAEQLTQQNSPPYGDDATQKDSELYKQERHQQGWYDPSDTLPQGKSWGDMIWRAERQIKNDVYVGDWVISRVKGEKGDAGELDPEQLQEIVDEVSALVKAGLTLIIEPQVIIVSQASKSDSSAVSPLTGSMTAKVRILRNGESVRMVKKPKSSVTVVGSTTGQSCGTATIQDEDANHSSHNYAQIVTLTSINSAYNSTTKRYDYVDDNGIIGFTLRVYDDDEDDTKYKDYSLTIKWYLNRLGARTQEIEGDVERTYMSRTEYSLSEETNNVLRGTKTPTIGSGAISNNTWGNAGNTDLKILTNISDTPVEGYTQAFRIETSADDFYQTHNLWKKTDTYKFSTYIRKTGGTVKGRITIKQGNSERFTKDIQAETFWTYVSFYVTLPEYVEAYNASGQLTSTAMFQLGITGSGTVDFLAPVLMCTYNASVIRADYEGKIESSASGISEEFTRKLSLKTDKTDFESLQTDYASYQRTSEENITNLQTDVRGIKTNVSYLEQTSGAIRMGVTNGWKNYIENPVATDGVLGTYSSASIVDDAVYGKVRQIEYGSGGDWQLKHNIVEAYEELTGEAVTWFCIVKNLSNGRLDFGSGSNETKGNLHAIRLTGYYQTVANVESLLSTSHYNILDYGRSDLGNGWYLCWVSAKPKSAQTTILENFSQRANSAGFNCMTGGWQIYYGGIVIGTGCPSIDMIKQGAGVKKAGIDIERGIIRLDAEKTVVTGNLQARGIDTQEVAGHRIHIEGGTFNVYDNNGNVGLRIGWDDEDNGAPYIILCNGDGSKSYKLTYDGVKQASGTYTQDNLTNTQLRLNASGYSASTINANTYASNYYKYSASKNEITGAYSRQHPTSSGVYADSWAEKRAQYDNRWFTTTSVSNVLQNGGNYMVVDGYYIASTGSSRTVSGKTVYTRAFYTASNGILSNVGNVYYYLDDSVGMWCDSDGANGQKTFNPNRYLEPTRE